MGALFYWLLDLVIDFLVTLNPARKEQVEQARAQAAELEAERTRLLTEIETGQKQLTALSQTLAEDAVKRRGIEDAISRSNAATAEKQAELDGLRGGDRVRVDL